MWLRNKIKDKTFFDYIYFIGSMRARFVTSVFYTRFFKSIGKGSWIKSPDLIFNAQKIEVGDNVRVEKGAVLYSVRSYAGINYNGRIIIGDGVFANRYFNVTAASLIQVGNNVAFGPNVFLNDSDHDYHDVNSSIIQSKLSIKGEIHIGDDSWIGANVFITGGVTLGKHCVVAANSVVTKSFPDYSVIAGSPAILIKYFDIVNKEWVRVKK